MTTQREPIEDALMDVPTRNLLRATLKRARGGFAAAAMFTFVVNLLILTMPIYMFQLFDRVMGSRNMSTLVVLFVIAVTAFVIQAVIDNIRSHVFIRLSSYIDKVLSPRLFAANMAAAMERGSAPNTDLLRDLQDLRLFLTGQAVFNVMDIPWTPLFMMVLFAFDAWIGAVAMIGLGMLFTLGFINDRITRAGGKESSAKLRQALGYADATARNARVVDSMGMRDYMVDRWAEAHDTGTQQQARVSAASSFVTAGSKFVMFTIQISVMSTAVIQMLTPGSTLTPGALIASVILVGRLIAPVQAAIGSWRMVTQAIDSYHRLNNALARQGNAEHSESRMSFARPEGRLSVENVGYQPAGREKPVLSRVNFEIAPGEVLGLVGPTAAGKTTLGEIIVGAVKPHVGAVRLDGIEMVSWRSSERGRYVGYLPQDIELFAGTIRDNIARFYPDAQDDDVIEAAQRAGLHEMILQLPKGYDSEIGHGGTLLSGGQRQRLALARALFGNPVLLVLDEPNASLDTAGEDALLTAVQDAKQRGSTVVIIAHRPGILQSADKVLILQNGAVARFGVRDEILPLISGRAPARPQQVTQDQSKPKSLPDRTAGAANG